MQDLEIQVDRGSDLPLYRQIANAIRGEIQSGRLAPRDRLPATRAISKDLGLPRKTIVRAFELLQAEGWLTAGVGQGTFVRESRAPGVAPRAERSRFAWGGRVHRAAESSPVWRYLGRARPEHDCIQFTGATADPTLFPSDAFREVVDEVLRREGRAALDYGPPEGIASLREWIAARLERRGVRVDPEQVLIVNGSQQGLDLIARLLIRPGERVLVEEPGYSNGFRLFQALGARTVGVPLDEGGVTLEGVRRAIAVDEARFIYLMPNFQNPTGLSLHPDRREPLLALCREHGVPIVEDQFDGDLVYSGDEPRPLKALDQDDQVLLLGSFSKILFPGLRLGWMVAPRELLSPLRELKQLADFSSGLLVQHAMDVYCRRGDLERHLERVRSINGTRLASMLEAMDREFPEDARWTRPTGGLTLWVTLPSGVDSWDLLQRAQARGVDFSPGMLFFPGGGGAQHLRLSYVREPEDRIREGVRILGSLIREASAKGNELSVTRPFF